MTVVAERTATAVPIELTVNNAGGVTGLTVLVAIRDTVNDEWLDFNDDTFKAAGWTTRQAAVAEVSAGNAPGIYRLAGGLDLSAMTNLPAGATSLIAEFDVSGTVSGNPSEEIQLVNEFLDIAADGAEMDLVTDAIDSDALATTGVEAIADQVWEEALADHSGTVGSTAEALDTAQSGSSPSVIADAVWDEARAGHVTGGTFGESVALRSAGLNVDAVNAIRDSIINDATTFSGADIDAAVSSRAVAGDAMDLIAGAVDAGALDTTAVEEIADGVWDEALAGHVGAGSAGQAQNRLDDDITSRAAPGDAMDLAANALDAAAIATSGANELADAVWDEDITTHVAANSAGEAQNRLDDDVTSRAAPGAQMALTAAERVVVTDAIWDEPTAGHTTAGTTGKALTDAGATADPGVIADAVWDESAAAHATVGSMGQLQNRLDTAVSTRAAPGAPMDLQSNAIDSAALDTSALDDMADAIWDEDITTHVAANSSGLELQNKAEAGDAMDLVADAVDATSLADAGRDKIVDQVWVEQIADHSGTAGSTAEALDNVSAPASPAVIAGAVWDEAMAGHTTAGTAGEQQNRLDDDVTSRAVAGDAMDLIADAVDSASLATSAVNEVRDSILSDSTPFAGADVDAAISTRAAQTTADDILADTAALDARLPSDPADESLQQAAHTQTQADIAALNDLSATAVENAVWDAATASHQTAGTTGKALTDAGATADPSAIADAVWDEAAADHTAAGSMGEAQNDASGVAAQVAKIDSAATVDPSAATSGSLLDRLANKDGSKTYDQSTDSLEGIRERIG